MQQAPEFTLPHIAGHTVSLSDFRGTPVVLIISGKGSADQAQQIGQTLGPRYLDGSVRLVTVLDMSNVPKLARPIANKMVAHAYKGAVNEHRTMCEQAGLQVPDSPEEAVVFTQDLEGKVAQSLGVTGVEDEAAAVVIGAGGELLAISRGGDPAPVIQALEQN